MIIIFMDSKLPRVLKSIVPDALISESCIGHRNKEPCSQWTSLCTECTQHSWWKLNKAAHEPCLQALLPYRCQMLFNKRLNMSKHREEVRVEQSAQDDWAWQLHSPQKCKQEFLWLLINFLLEEQANSVLLFTPLALASRIWTRGSTKEKDNTSTGQN